MRIFILLAGFACSAIASPKGGAPFQVHWQGWIEQGRIMQASDSLQGPGRDPIFDETINMTGAAIQSSGAQVTVIGDLGENWTGAFGIGGYRSTHSKATWNASHAPSFFNISLYKAYVAEARLTYFRGDREAPSFSLTAGNFSYKYNPDVHNLGLYLLRGPVYPGLLMSGFGEHDVDPAKAEHTGFHARQVTGRFEQNLLFVNERDLPPTFDWSLAYVAKYRPMQALEVGTGVNFYRLIPYSKRLATVDYSGYWEPSGDTVTYTHQGTKLMAMFSLDLKHWFAPLRASGHDLRLYGEAALLGVKDYGSVYDDPLERLPILLGFNFPSYGLLDRLSLEVEWYGSPYRNDLYNIGNPSSIVADWMTSDRPVPSPLPVAGEYKYADRDNWKWSLLAQKVVARHVQFTAQIANDHYRPAPVATDVIFMSGGTATAMTAPRDWYFMGRIGFLF